MSATVSFLIDSDLVDIVEIRARALGVRVETLMDQAIGTEKDWRDLVMQKRIRPLALEAPREVACERRTSVMCDCCRPGTCKHVLFWRGRYRCQCTPDRLAGVSERDAA